MENNIRNTYLGYFIQSEKLLKSASGGAATVLSEMIISQGGCVFGVAYSRDFYRAEYVCAESIEELERLKGSKYFETSKKIVIDNGVRNVFEILAERLQENRLVLFFGLGCDVAVAKAYCDKKNINTEKLFLVELLCHGPVDSEIHKQYIEKLEKKYRAKIVDFNVRYKKEGWIPPYIRAVFENGKVYEIPFYESDYGWAFSYSARRACYECKYKGANHKGDMTIGDFWGITNDMENWNKNGVSLIFTQTSKGEELVNLIRNLPDFYLALADTLFALQNNPSYSVCREKPKGYDDFIKSIEEKGLTYAVNHAQTRLGRMKRMLRRVLPSKIVTILLKIKYKLKLLV